ncbi:MAG: hypothetical protein CO021_04020 [Deltaproteobacteria bacterium CG_4_9_14_0_2_um_filter_42_21]|nr:MAG: hypothetical protein CO021_04020 [Deltaproteobacteria bacterium CG_4_9_14_0_2_um_filter_42_21]
MLYLIIGGIIGISSLFFFNNESYLRIIFLIIGAAIMLKGRREWDAHSFENVKMDEMKKYLVYIGVPIAVLLTIILFRYYLMN